MSHLFDMQMMVLQDTPGRLLKGAHRTVTFSSCAGNIAKYIKVYSVVLPAQLEYYMYYVQVSQHEYYIAEYI